MDKKCFSVALMILLIVQLKPSSSELLGIVAPTLINLGIMSTEKWVTKPNLRLKILLKQNSYFEYQQCKGKRTTCPNQGIPQREIPKKKPHRIPNKK